MRSFSSVTDFSSQNVKPSKLGKLFIPYLHDKRDLPFIYFMLQISFTFVPLAFVAFFIDNTSWLWWCIFVIYGAGLIFFAGPFILMMHNTSHRPFFKPHYKAWNRYIPWVLCPFMGQSPDTYFSHHIGMHHVENNLEKDLSTTMKYQRDSFKDFMKYFVKFLFVGVIELVEYLKYTKKEFLRKRTIRGEIFYLILSIILLFVNFRAAMMVFILPMIVVRFSMMMGNWAQHAFIDPDHPENNYQNSITCINSVYNKRCYNDGYHIGHHIRPNLHWTEMPIDFSNNIEAYVKHKSIIFEKIDYFQIWLYLMLKKYDWLADNFVNIGDTFGSNEEVIDFMKYRLQKM
ncbi:MAG: fatty acid desaturase [Saprospiraceae bacterium]